MGYYEDALNLAERLGTTVAPRDRVQSRAIRSRVDLAIVVDERMSFIGVGEDEVSARAGVPIETVRRMRTTGAGSLEDMWAVLEAISIYPVCLPDPSEQEADR